MASINKVILIGNLGRDPEMRYTQGGTAVCQLSLATTRTYTNKSNDRVEETEWHRIVVWGKQAESCNQYLSKGRQAYIEGRLQTRNYDDKDGNKKYITEVIADVVQFLGSRGEGGGAGAGAGAGGGAGGGGGGGAPRGGGGGGGGGGAPRSNDRGGAGGGAGGPTQAPEDFNDSYIPSEPGDDDIPF